MVFIFLLQIRLVSAQTPPVSQSAGGLEKLGEELEEKKQLEQRILKEKGEEKETGITEEEKVIPEEEKIFIRKIEVEGVSFIPSEAVTAITVLYEGKKLSLREMQKICDLITDEYRKKGFVTSRAYLPPQTIKEGILKIMVIEGKLGEVEIEGNRYFKTSLLLSKLTLEAGDPFEYSDVQDSLRRMNEHPDRVVKAVLAPGKEPGTTDILLKVEDNLPVHAGLGYDNFGSRYIEKDRYSLFFEHNNIFGFDDRLYFKYQRAQASLYEMKNIRYSIPLTNDLELSLYYLRSKMKLGQEYEDSDIRGKSDLTGLFLTERVITDDVIDLSLNCGFDYKHIRNFTMGEQTSRDEVRVFKLGADSDSRDSWGRTIFTVEGDWGVPDIFGGVEDKDPFATRIGAGGKFFKIVSNVYRLQPMPFSSTLLLKNNLQFSNYTLLSCEQFQIGGITNVRAYPPAEYSGDKGLASSLEWSFPLYFLPKDINVPFSKSKFYDVSRVVVFYDWATTHLNKVLPGDNKHQTLRGWGFGYRFNLPKDFSLRVETAYSLGKTPSDEKHRRTYVSVTKSF